ncbi:cytochrome c-type biogenesis protein CcmH [Pseudonocardia sp. MH-G8]|uniref:cytochrome c-type biogenesis protein n=1 Tax=Pseudonocardia sp. MH-G8 TaxID=1854588 RepID=UPI0013041DFF|nr:cytochrome c-type biogenesis protein CcmH [Pseudonocardia sp. MH-G8]
MTRRVLAVVGVVAVLVLAGVGLWRAGQDRPETLEQRTEAIAAELGCPTCEAQSVAMSRSEIATAMRAEISGQLNEGRTPEQIRAWFADRYGPAVLLDPPAAGVGLVVWVVPAVLLGAGLALTAVVVRRRAPAQAAVPRVPAPRVRWVVPLAALGVAAAGVTAWLTVDSPAAPAPPPAVAAAVAAPEPAADPEAWLARGAALEAERKYGPSADAYRTAADLRPQDVRAQVRLGLVLLKAGEPAEAESAARRILVDRPAHPEGLLVLGLAQRALGAAEAPGTLQRFLETAPTHPAAAEVRRLLAGT